jgi:hypothetical protein
MEGEREGEMKGKGKGMYAEASPQVVPVTAFGSTVVEARRRRTS